jgi:hypothetical protein
MKTKPSGVRFDESKLDFIYKKEGLKTKQSVVTFLMDAYWDVYNPKKIVFAIPDAENYDGTKNRSLENNEVGQWQKPAFTPKPIIKRSFVNYQQLLLECDSEDDYFRLAQEIEVADHLTIKERNTLLKK